jgi:hypothetical protein
MDTSSSEKTSQLSHVKLFHDLCCVLQSGKTTSMFMMIASSCRSYLFRVPKSFIRFRGTRLANEAHWLLLYSDLSFPMLLLCACILFVMFGLARVDIHLVML